MSTINGTPYAKPGNVQATIDSVAGETNNRIVKLYPDHTYDPTEQWVIKEGVTLDFNGAQANVTSDIDVIQVNPEGSAVNVDIDVSGVTGYSGNVISLDASLTGPWQNYQGPGKTVIEGYVEGTLGEGTGIYLHQNHTTDDGEFVTFARFNVDIEKIGTGIEIHSESPTGWLDNNFFTGTLSRFRKGIHIHGAHARDRDGTVTAKGNHFDTMLQPKQGESEVGIHWDVGGMNIFRDRISDVAHFTDVAVRFGPEAEDNVVFTTGGIGDSVVDEGDDASNAVFESTSFHGLGVAGAGTSVGIVPKGEVAKDQSTGFGFGNIAGLRGSTFGWKAKAPADNASAFGAGAGALNTATSAFGRNAVASAFRALSIGNGTTCDIREGGRIGVKGLVYGASPGTVADEDLQNEELTIEADEVHEQFRLRYRDSSGEVRTGVVPFEPLDGDGVDNPETTNETQ